MAVFIRSFTDFSAPPAPSTTGVYFIGAPRQGTPSACAALDLDGCAPLQTPFRVAGFAKKKVVFKGEKT
jgi:hypothetical protein